MSTPYISIVSPVYKGAEMVAELVARVSEACQSLTEDFEIILVDDASPDHAWEEIAKACAADQRVKGIQLSRNFGQHYAITAGLDYSRGEWVVVMDCDLQDQPEEIPNLYIKAQEGYEVVLASRAARQDSFFKRFFSWLFYAVLSYLTGVKYDSTIANFGIYHRKVIDSVTSMRESIRVFPIMVRWVGFRQVAIPVKHSQRKQGQSSYTLKRLVNLAFDITLSNSDKPLQITVQLGFIIASLTFCAGLINLYLYFKGQILVPGYASLILSIWFLSGVIIATLGLLGLYIGKIFQGVKERPIYLISKHLNA